MAFKKILCPVDFSEPSRAAMHVAAQLSKEWHAELVLMHVWRLPQTYGPELLYVPSLVETTRAGAEQAIASWKADAEQQCDRPVSTRVKLGVPWITVVDEATNDPAIDLIVVGTHGRTGIKRALLGSVAEQVVRHAPCPVLIAREPRGEPRPSRT